MNLPVVAIRPEPGCAATLAAGRARGLDMYGFPLFDIRPRPWTPPPADSVDGVLLGSANAVRHGDKALAAYRDKPVYAVGEATAAAAREAGFNVTAVGKGGLQAVIEPLQGPLRLLRLAGEEHVSLRAPPGVTIETRVVYAAEPLPMPAALVAILRSGAVVMLHSAAAARHFEGECLRLGVPRRSIWLAALGPRIAAAAGESWAACRSAEEPSEEALLALAADLCHVSGEAKEP